MTDKNPLEEADPKSVLAILSGDPEKLTDEEIERACVELRAQRARWQLAEQKGKKVSKTAVPSDLSLGDLGL